MFLSPNPYETYHPSTNVAVTPFLYKSNCMSQTTSNKIQENKNLHFSINATGVNISSYEGSISYSIGQVFYSSHDSQQNYVTEGIPHPDVYDDLPNKPVLFSGVYADLQNKPELYNKTCSSNNDYAL